VAIDVFPDAVQWTYTVDNSQGDRPVPYGFAIHPWFVYQGERGRTRLTVPATHWMEAVDLLPTGRLVSLDETDLDARQGRSLEGFVIDDVYFGMKPVRPTKIDFLDAGLALELAASQEFTHLVVYTPLEPHFCVENQTCSTDAHNLYARGLKRESNLQIVPPGQSQSGWVRLTIRSTR
jgi:aldose 1-epimerase